MNELLDCAVRKRTLFQAFTLLTGNLKFSEFFALSFVASTQRDILARSERTKARSRVTRNMSVSFQPGWTMEKFYCAREPPVTKRSILFPSGLALRVWMLKSSAEPLGSEERLICKLLRTLFSASSLKSRPLFVFKA